MVGGQVTVVPRNPVTLGDSIGTLADALRTDSLDAQNRKTLAYNQQSAVQKRQDDIDKAGAEATLKRIEDYKAMGVTRDQIEKFLEMHAKQFPNEARFMGGYTGIPLSEAETTNIQAGTNRVHIGRDASALVRDQYENPNAAPAPSRALIDAHLPGTAPATAEDQFKAQDRDNVTGGANPLGSPAVPGVPVPSRNPIAGMLRGETTAATTAPTAPTATAPPTPPTPPTPSPAVTRPPMPVSTDGHNTAGTLTGGALHRMFAGDLSAEPSTETSRGPGAVPAAAAANVDQASTSTPAPASASAPDYMQGVVPAKPPNSAQMEATRQRQGLDLNAEQQLGAADKVGTLNNAVRKTADEAAHQRRSDASESNYKSALADKARAEAADSKSKTNVPPVALKANGTPDYSGASPLVRQALNVDFDPTAMAKRWKPDEQRAFAQEVQQYNPGWSWGDYAKRWKVKQNFASGKDADTVRSANQFIGHVGSLVDAHNHMQNRDTTFTNAIGNFLQTEVPGAVNPEIQKAAGKIGTEAHGVGTEFTKFMRGAGVVPEKEVLMSMNGLTPNTPPAKLQGAVEGMLEMAATALEKLKEKYVNGVGTDAGFKENVADKIISPDVVNVVKKLKTKGYDVSHFENVIQEIQNGRLSGGGGSAVVLAPTQSLIPTYAHTATGPNGHKIGSNDGNTWFDAQTGKPVN